MTEFMVLVERAVRPVAASPTRKMRMREELLAHLTGIYDEELARTGDEATARAEAARRFGDPAGLTAELEESLSLRDRLDGWLNRWFGARDGEPVARSVLRLAVLVGLLLLPCFAIGLVAAAERRPVDPTVPTTATLVRLWGAGLICTTAEIVLIGWLAVRIRDALYPSGRAVRSVPRAVGYAVLLTAATPLVMAGLYLATYLDVAEVFETLAEPSLLVACGLLGLMVSGVVVLYARENAQFAARRAEWARLTIAR